MKKVLALVLALTMVLGFAATASASYFNFKTEFFTNGATNPTVGGLPYTDEMNVDGNKEYTVKYVFDDGDINPIFEPIGSNYDALLKEYRAYEIIYSYTRNNFAGSADWDFDDVTGQDGDNALNADIVGTANDGQPYYTSDIWQTLQKLMQDGATFKEAYKSSTFQAAIDQVIRAYNSNYAGNSYYGYEDGIAVTASSKDSTYATITSQPTVSAKRVGNAGNMTTEYTVEFKVRFTNTTFRTADVDLEVLFTAGGVTPQSYYSSKDTLSFTVFQAQYRTFTEQDALIAFGVTPNVEISADDYAYISADAFRLMLQNSSRSITVVSGMGDSKVRFDKDSTNLPQDVFVGNFTTSANSDSVSINGFSSTTSAKIKIAVGRSFYNANNGKVISVYDANGNKLDVEATLQGDYTVNFYAPLSNYTVAGTDWAGQTVPSTDAGKTNPSMGGAF